jgi:isoamylase
VWDDVHGGSFCSSWIDRDQVDRPTHRPARWEAGTADRETGGVRAFLFLLASSCTFTGPDHPIEMTEPRFETELDPPQAVLEPRNPTCTSRRGLPSWGARVEGDRLQVRVRSRAATRMLVELYDQPRFAPPIASFVLEREGEIFSAEIPLEQIEGAIYYGLRAWGPNWPFVPEWTPGSNEGFRATVDADGNRFNPNALLVDPYALELSHDPIEGDDTPKGIILPTEPLPCWTRARRPLSESIIYEVHVRGFTKQDPSVPAEWRGTYRGAAEKAEYLASLGVTAIELLPIYESPNDQNDLAQGTDGDNYWGYGSLSFFAPDRRYAFDRSPGGPTREVREMVRAFHDAGIEVYLDVVYNHTAEGGHLSWRGIDNAAYYELSEDGQSYANHNGVGPDFNAKDPLARDLVLDSLRYWVEELGVDGFRFDLAPLLGNGCARGCFTFQPNDPQGVLQRATELGVKLIAEPWAIAPGTYQLGGFPRGWSEWNGNFRDTIRRDQNTTDAVTPAELARRLLGSPDLFADDGRDPNASINYVVCHDGFTLRDLYSYTTKVNDRPWPYGPSRGGDDYNISSDYGGDPELQQRAARTGLALLMVSAGATMFTGGDEMYRTQYGNNNPYNVDSPANWLDWAEAERHPGFLGFARALIDLRHRHAGLRSATAELFDDQGAVANAGYLADPVHHFLGILREETYVAYNGWSGSVRAQLPDPGAGRTWRRVIDTAAWLEPETEIGGRIYDVFPQSVVIFVR